MAEKRNSVGKKVNKDRSTHVILFIFLAIILISLIAAFFITFYVSGDDVNIMELPEIEFSMNTADSEKSHNFKIKFSIEGNISEIKKLDESKLLNVIRETLSKGDYEKMIGDNGTMYIKQLVTDELSRQFELIDGTDFNFEGVYINEIINDYYSPLHNKGAEDYTGRTGEDIANMFKKK